MPLPLQILALLAVLAAPYARAAPFLLAAPGEPPAIVHDDSRTLTLAADLLRHDLRAVAGVEASTSTDLSACTRVCVVVGTAGSPTVKALARQAGVDLAPLQGQWERYLRVARAMEVSARRVVVKWLERFNV
ncbi:hypothetical protein ACEN88_24190, partial [Massilia sp. CT11-108]